MSENASNDFSAEFSSIRTTALKKYLLKKPNLNEPIKKFKELAASLEDAEMFDQAAYCNKEIASFYEGLENTIMEKCHLLKAANLFHKAVSKQKKMQLIFSTELVQLMEECYLVAIERILRQQNPRIAGLTYLELANKFELLDEFYKSYAILIKANKFLQGDIYSQITIIEKMADLMPKQYIREYALDELQTIWISIPKTQINDGIIPVLLALEGRILLLQLYYSRPNIPPLSYEAQWRNSHGKSSVANKEIFHIFSQFIKYIRQQNYFKATELYSLELEKILDSKGQELCKLLLDSLNYTCKTIISHEFDEIFESGLNETQKRLAMFELISSSNIQKS